jgi:hypothetical protein
VATIRPPVDAAIGIPRPRPLRTLRTAAPQLRGPYEYPRYHFSNRSDDIRQLFVYACELVGVAWRPWGKYHISVARRDAVELLDQFVGPKS